MLLAYCFPHISYSTLTNFSDYAYTFTSCPLVQNTAFMGRDLNSNTAHTKDRKYSAIDCRLLCWTHPRCEFFTWNKKTHACQLKTSDKNRRYNPDTTSGYVCKSKVFSNFIDVYSNDVLFIC